MRRRYALAIIAALATAAPRCFCFVYDPTQLARREFARAILTKLEPQRTCYAAEDHHQDFLVKHAGHPYIVMHDFGRIRDLQQALYRPMQGWWWRRPRHVRAGGGPHAPAIPASSAPATGALSAPSL